MSFGLSCRDAAVVSRVSFGQGGEIAVLGRHRRVHVHHVLHNSVGQLLFTLPASFRQVNSFVPENNFEPKHCNFWCSNHCTTWTGASSLNGMHGSTGSQHLIQSSTMVPRALAGSRFTAVPPAASQTPQRAVSSSPLVAPHPPEYAHAQSGPWQPPPGPHAQLVSSIHR